MDKYAELRLALDEALRFSSDCFIVSNSADIRELLAERDALRDALKNMMTLYDGMDDQSALGQYASQARYALAQGDL